MKFLIVNNLKLDPSLTNLAFEHVQPFTCPIAILQYWWRGTILMELMCLIWQHDHPTIPWCETSERLACIHDNAKDTPFNRLRETMHLACIVLGDGLNIQKFVWINYLTCTIDGQVVTIDTL